MNELNLKSAINTIVDSLIDKINKNHEQMGLSDIIDSGLRDKFKCIVLCQCILFCDLLNQQGKAANPKVIIIEILKIMKSYLATTIPKLIKLSDYKCKSF